MTEYRESLPCQPDGSYIDNVEAIAARAGDNVFNDRFVAHLANDAADPAIIARLDSLPDPPSDGENVKDEVMAWVRDYLMESPFERPTALCLARSTASSRWWRGATSGPRNT